MKKLFIFFLFTGALLFSENKIITENDYNIKYFSKNRVDYFSSRDDLNNYYNFFNSNDNVLKLEIYSGTDLLNIFSIETGENAYFEIRYEKKTNTFEILNLLGEYELNFYNSFITTNLKINGIEIINYPSNYRIISYPGENIFIEVVDGKINIKLKKESIILIGGESIKITGNKYQLTDIKNIYIAKNIIFTETFSNYNEIFLSNNENISKYLKNKSSKIDIYSFFSKKEFETLKINFIENIYLDSFKNNFLLNNYFNSFLKSNEIEIKKVINQK
jgi:hypothetical protein